MVAMRMRRTREGQRGKTASLVSVFGTPMETPGLYALALLRAANDNPTTAVMVR